MTADRPLLGITLMLGFCIVAPISDAVAKVLGESVSIGLLLFFRFAVQVALLIPVIMLTNRPWRMRGNVLFLASLRTVLHVIGIGLMFAALQYLPLADAVAIAFVMPFIMLVLGRYVLKEHVGRRRLFGAVVGFGGTLLVVQPSFVAVGWAALLPLGVALNFAFFMLITRKIARDSDPIGLQAVSGVMASVFLLPVLIIGTQLDIAPLAYVAPNLTEITLLISIGVLGTMAHLLMTWSLRHAPSATLAPMQYLEIPIAALIGWEVFGDWPNDMALVGIAITIAAGLFIILTERSSAPVPVAPAPATPKASVPPAE
ncbi:DMT family transporter [Rhodobacteraceae bacterium D3-12]|nr:DMT family transporter [Rhodobacteraceae bacterium D3-12]